MKKVVRLLQPNKPLRIGTRKKRAFGPVFLFLYVAFEPDEMPRARSY